MKHPKFKGIGTLDAELDIFQKELLSKEIEFNWIVNELKNADPSVDNINRLRQQLRSKEKQVIKARRQVKAKKDQRNRKVNERQHSKLGGQAKKKERLALNRAINEEMKKQENILSQLNNVKINVPFQKKSSRLGLSCSSLTHRKIKLVL
ncbi:hypothetical protein ACE1BU_21910 [Aeromonas veronii]|uniref:hypothetical protein n=1 Tax=Aeromonas veronii TaxID=654 RepID=UPI0035BB8D87